VENVDNKKIAGRWKLFAVLAVCAAPMIASYFTYYVIQPQAKNNYGTILDPRQFPVPPLSLVNEADGKTIALADLNGKWLMVQVDQANCTETCQKKLLEMRQLRVAQGKAMDRIERVWLITDTQKVDEKIKPGIAGTHLLRADRAMLEKWLPVDSGTHIQDHIYLIDPLGNLMMRFPKDADPNKVKKDLGKLLKASAIG
jgi:hypothetical protein